MGFRRWIQGFLEVDVMHEGFEGMLLWCGEDVEISVNGIQGGRVRLMRWRMDGWLCGEMNLKN